MKALLAIAVVARLPLTVPVALLAAGQPAAPRPAAVAHIPPAMREPYQAAWGCPGLAWRCSPPSARSRPAGQGRIVRRQLGRRGRVDSVPPGYLSPAYGVDGDGALPDPLVGRAGSGRRRDLRRARPRY